LLGRKTWPALAFQNAICVLAAMIVYGQSHHDYLTDNQRPEDEPSDPLQVRHPRDLNQEKEEEEHPDYEVKLAFGRIPFVCLRSGHECHLS
jgi:hypothetical protein